MAELLSAEAVRVGAVRGRYFRENFAQGGIDLAQIVPELVTNADAAIAAGGRSRGRIEVRFGAPDLSPLPHGHGEFLETLMWIDGNQGLGRKNNPPGAARRSHGD